MTLAAEYARLRDAFGWGIAEFLAANLNAIRAAFVEPSVKQTLEYRLREHYCLPRLTNTKWKADHADDADQR